jgi:hypothetical protein
VTALQPAPPISTDIVDTIAMTDTHAEAFATYPPPAEFTAQANATTELYKAAEADRLAFWADQANRPSWPRLPHCCLPSTPKSVP